MKNLVWIIALIVSFTAGYFFRDLSQEPPASTPTVPISQHLNKITDDANASTPKISKEITPTLDKPIETAEQQAAKAAARKAALDVLEATADPKVIAQKFPKEITDEEIDRVLPAPFNKSLKNNHGELREKYKEFAETSTSNDWDTNMQHKLTDFILSRPYAKFISVESLACKAGLCEIRLFESKNGAWQFILSEMALQDWWDFGSYGSSGLSPEEGDKRGTSYLVLLTRKPSMQ